MKVSLPFFFHTEFSPQDAFTPSTLKSWAAGVISSWPRLKSRCGINQRSSRLLPVIPTTRARSPLYRLEFLVLPQSHTHSWSRGRGAGSMSRILVLLSSATIHNLKELSSAIPNAMQAASCNVLASTNIRPGMA